MPICCNSIFYSFLNTFSENSMVVQRFRLGSWGLGLIPGQANKKTPKTNKQTNKYFFPLAKSTVEKAMAPHSSPLAWKIPWTDEPGGLQSMGSLESDTTERLHFHFSLSCIGEGNGNPLQCSCLENPRDGGAWWATI